MNILKFLKSGFNSNLGYSIINRTYFYEGKSYIGFILAKNYTMFWIPGYDKVEVFCDKNSLDQYITSNSIKLN